MYIACFAPTAIHVSFCSSYLGLLWLGSFQDVTSSERLRAVGTLGDEGSEHELRSHCQVKTCEVFKKRSRTLCAKWFIAVPKCNLKVWTQAPIKVPEVKVRTCILWGRLNTYVTVLHYFLILLTLTDHWNVILNLYVHCKQYKFLYQYQQVNYTICNLRCSVLYEV